MLINFYKIEILKIKVIKFKKCKHLRKIFKTFLIIKKCLIYY